MRRCGRERGTGHAKRFPRVSPTNDMRLPMPNRVGIDSFVSNCNSSGYYTACETNQAAIAHTNSSHACCCFVVSSPRRHRRCRCRGLSSSSFSKFSSQQHKKCSRVSTPQRSLPEPMEADGELLNGLRKFHRPQNYSVTPLPLQKKSKGSAYLSIRGSSLPRQ